jgi:DNA polymerase I-like protein with 3'-5' exonuclease and polymerase domains
MKYQSMVLDVETTKVPRHKPWIDGAYLVSVLTTSLVTGETKAWLFQHPECVQSFKQSAEEIQQELNAHDLLINQNIKFDLHWMDTLGLNYQHMRLFDTQVAEYLISGQLVKMISLHDLCEQYHLPGKIDKVKQMWDAGFETDEIPANILIPYGNQDTVCTGQVAQKQVPILLQQNQWTLLQIQMRELMMLKQAEFNGMKPDIPILQKYSSEFETKLNELDAELLSISGNEIFNINSPPQKSALFFGGIIKHKMLSEEFQSSGLGDVPSIAIISSGPKWTTLERTVKGMGFAIPDNLKATEKGYSTDKNALSMLEPTNEEQRRALKIVSERNGLAKIRSTYLEGLQKKVHADGLLHTNFKQSWTNTGRGSSEDPNNQNMPRDKTGPIKQSFVTRF